MPGADFGEGSVRICHSRSMATHLKEGHSLEDIVVDDRMPDDGRLYSIASPEAHRVLRLRAEEIVRERVREKYKRGDPWPGDAWPIDGEKDHDPVHRPRVYNHDRWDAMVSRTVNQMLELGHKKGGEYAGDVDRLANFRRNGERLGLPMETVWAVYAGKHWDAISQFIMDQRNGKERSRMEPIAGRVDDLLVYLMLFKCMLDEAGLIGDPSAAGSATRSE